MVTELGLGAMDTPNSPEATETITAALDLGINFIDTAREYAGSEFLLGQVIRTRSAADVHLASKTFSHTMDGSQRDIDRSVSVLGVDQIALYQLHDISTPEAWRDVHEEEGALAGLQVAQYRGLIGHIGVSTHSIEVLEQIVESDAFAAVMVEYSAFYPQTVRLIERAHERDIGVIVMRPLGGSGRTSEMRGRLGAGYDGVLTPKNLLRYVLSHPGVSTVIPGARYPSRVIENVETATSFTPLTVDECRELEAAAAALY